MKRIWWTVLTILAVVILAVVILSQENQTAEEETAKCIGENAALYVQLGCHACEAQEQMFGENVKYLNIIDCFYETDKCAGIITATPTWEINGNFYSGVQSIEKLKELTGCV